jgi:putative methionine-R-sulfoxide reductase with GAF domain
MDDYSPTPRLGLRELIDPSRWQQLQTHFARVLGVLIRTISSSHELLVAPSWPPNVEADRAINLLKIGDELDQLVPRRDAACEGTTVTTTLGVTYALVPIRMTAENIVAYFVVGPAVLGSREDELQFHRRVGAMGLDAEALHALLVSLKLYTFTAFRSALNLLEEVGTSIAQLAYQAKQLTAMAPGSPRIDEAVITYHTDRVLHSLLDAATLATKADGGSVMLYDPRRDELKIRAAQGLSDEIIATTALRRGEGLAGLAAQERRLLLLDDQTFDGRLRARMGRAHLVSSLIAPLTVEGASQPLGVLNLRTSNPQRRFTQEHMELLRRLIDLTDAALSNLQVFFFHARSAPTP